MITILDLNRVPTAILENAYNVGYSKVSNILSSAHFSIPADDNKIKHIKPLHFAEIIDDNTEEYIGLFRILPKRHRLSNDTNELTYDLEHVLGTLFGKTLFKYHQFTNFTTREVIESLLGMQHTKHWVVGDIEFTRYFHYSFENENLLNAIFSIPKSFDEPYIWETDTTTYPWKLHLRKPKTEISSRIMEGYNLNGFALEENPYSICNRIYPLGAGEGVNQLDIRDVNNGLPYVEDEESITKHGLYEYTWVDRRFTDAESLKSSASGLLEKWSKPLISWQTDVLDVSSITGIEADKIREGKNCRITLEEYGEIDLRVVSEIKSDITGNNEALQVVLGNNIDDLGTTQTDLERRQQINELYSQGATNILNYSYQDNADSEIPATIPFYLDSDVVNINTCELTFRTKRFRAYSQATKGGGAIVESTSSGGATTRSTTSGGSVSRSTSSGGSSTQTSTAAGQSTQTSTSNGESTRTSSANGSHRHVMFQTGGDFQSSGNFVNAATGSGGITLGPGTPLMTNISTLSASDNHSHSVTTPAHRHDVTTPSHRHDVTIPNHTHDFEIPNHSHDVTIPAHTHDITLPNHSHEVEHKITELSTLPSQVEIRVDGNLVPETSLSQNRMDIVDYLRKDTNGKIQRGNHEIEIKPSGLARIEADLILRVFIQSQLGGNY